MFYVNPGFCGMWYTVKPVNKTTGVFKGHYSGSQASSKNTKTMRNIIPKMLASLFEGKAEFRTLILGLDDTGKTAILYRLKLGHVLTTIPTIGFNVETIELPKGSITAWDIGGCDKIRPLWRHYYQNTHAVIFVVDSSDNCRLLGGGPDSALGLIDATLQEDELRDCIVLIYLNKQDLPQALPKEALVEKLQLNAPQRAPHVIHVQPCSAVTGQGLTEGVNWLISTLIEKKKGKAPPELADVENGTLLSTPGPPTEEDRLAALLEEWLEREDDSEDDFLAKLENYTLETWDHYTHLRIAYLMLRRFGRPLGLPRIFNHIRNFIEHSPRTKRLNKEGRGTTFHETMTFFWVHMVHYAMAATKLPKDDFKTFLLLNPQLVNGGLFLNYYSRELMLLNPESRTRVMLPDLHSLPSRLPAGIVDAPSSAAVQMPKVCKMLDGQLYHLFRQNRLPAWGHDLKTRLIYIMLNLFGRSKGGVNRILHHLQGFEGQHFHTTHTYFWIQMLTYLMTSLEKTIGTRSLWRYGTLPDADVTDAGRFDAILENVLPYNDFLLKIGDATMLASTCVNKYYSKSLLDKEEAKSAFVLPDIKQLPSVVP